MVACLLAECRQAGGRPAVEEQIHKAVLRIMASDGEFSIVFAEDGSPAGVAHTRYRCSAWHKGRDARLENLFVATRHRRRGIGRLLLEEVMSRARAKGCSCFELDVRDDDDAAKSLYRACGFSETATGGSSSRLMGRRL